MDEFLRGWTVAREIPPDVIDGVNRGAYQVHGGVIRMAPGTDEAGRIVRHLIPARQDPPVPSGAFPDLSLARNTQQLLQVATGTMLLSGLDLAVSAVGFAVLYKKLTDLDKSLTAIKGAVDGIARLLDLEEKAKLAAALKTLSMVMKGGAFDSRKQQLLNERLLNAVLNVFGPVNMKYRELLPAAESETAMACQKYFALTSLATAACHAELGMVRVAKDNLDDDCAFWAQQARRIAGDLLGEHPERFVAGEFVSEVSLREVAAWLNFAADEDRSEPERIDELRNRIRLSTNKGGGLIAIPLLGKDDPAAVAKTIEADKQETIPALRELVARHGVLRGYADQYALLDENGMTPSEFQRRVDALDQGMLVDGYVILEPAQADLATRPTR